MGGEGCGVVIIHKYLWVSASTGVSIHRHILSFGSTAFCKNLISLLLLRDCRRFCVALLSSDDLFHPKSDGHVYLQLLELALGTAVAASRKQHKSTV